MELAMVTAAERHRGLVADLATERALLRKPQIMWICRLAPADKAGMGGNELQMIAVTQPEAVYSAA
jgi:hypothetical protein